MYLNKGTENAKNISIFTEVDKCRERKIQGIFCIFTEVGKCKQWKMLGKNNWKI